MHKATANGRSWLLKQEKTMLIEQALGAAQHFPRLLTTCNRLYIFMRVPAKLTTLTATVKDGCS